LQNFDVVPGESLASLYHGRAMPCRELLPQVCELLEQRGWLASDALIYLEREKEMADLALPASWKLLKDKQAGQVCYQLYLRDTKHDAAV
jgi:16S rRNA (guanine966-N2)-methyltransferase